MGASCPKDRKPRRIIVGTGELGPPGIESGARLEACHAPALYRPALFFPRARNYRRAQDGPVGAFPRTGKRSARVLSITSIEGSASEAASRARTPRVMAAHCRGGVLRARASRDSRKEALARSIIRGRAARDASLLKPDGALG